MLLAINNQYLHGNDPPSQKYKTDSDGRSPPHDRLFNRSPRPSARTVMMELTANQCFKTGITLTQPEFTREMNDMFKSLDTRLHWSSL